jgi:large subunit ribosomal protein L5
VVPRLQEKYVNEVLPKMKEKFGVKNMLAVPRLDKIVINMGVGRAMQDAKILENAQEVLATITGQKPIVTRARIAIANFKLRENAAIGCKVTLRRSRMYEFMDRFLNVALPRIRDFNGVSNKSFDKAGNYSIGITEHVIFPEVDTGKVLYTHGMDITFVFNKGPKEQTKEVLALLGMPFTKKARAGESPI